MTIDPKKSGASPSAPTWGNWSGNIVHEPPTNGANYYFRPTNLVELKSVLADAVTKGVTVRVSGQRHSQPPLVTNDNRAQCRRCPRPIWWTCRAMRMWYRAARILWFWGPDQTRSR